MGAGPAERTAAQQRIVDAALRLFAEHGVSATSLQMIADDLGVTKAAVYHQYHSKDDIVVAVMAGPLAELDAVVRSAVARPTRADQLTEFLDGFTHLVVRHRQVVGTLHGDPSMVRVIRGHDALNAIATRLQELVMGPLADDGATAERVRGLMVLNAVTAAAAHEELADVADAELRTNLVAVARRMFELPERPTGHQVT